MKKVLLILFLSGLSIAPVMVSTVAALDCAGQAETNCREISKCTWKGTNCIQSAAGATTPAPTVVTSAQGLLNLIDGIGDWAFAAVLVVSALFLIYAGFLWATAGGNPEGATKARTMLTNALIGVVVALLARGLVQVVKSVIGG